MNDSCRSCAGPQDSRSCETLIESKSSGIPVQHKANTRKFSFDRMKCILKKPSSITGDSLYDHLVEIIKRIIDERPLNVVDYFEEFSRDVREHKHILSDSPCTQPPSDPEFLRIAKAVLKSVRLYIGDEEFGNLEMHEDRMSSQTTGFFSLMSSTTKMHRILSQNENVIQLQHFWGFCGLGAHIDEVFQLSWAIQKIQHHNSIRTARFWGRIYGAKASYYVVEAEVTKTERMLRMEQMEAKMVSAMIAFIRKKMMAAEPQEPDPELIPGHDWQDYPEEDLRKMQPQAAPVPRFILEDTFELPPEPIGTGLNRKTYFVSRQLSEEWKELPAVTPKEVVMSRKIRKVFTGDLEANLSSFPPYPGTEKNYLRAMIARITAGSYIAPTGYFRKMTKKERLAAEEDSIVYDEEGEQEELEEIDFEDEFEDDCPIIEDEMYEPLPFDDLKHPRTWVHCRPHILKQGTISYIDEEEAIKNLARVALKRMKEMETGLGEAAEEAMGLETEPETEAELDGEGEEFVEEEDIRPEPETGPELFTNIEHDQNSEHVEPWSSRRSEYCNSDNQTIVMRSNLWPGSYSFIHGKYWDSMYLGWGTKFVGRCGVMQHLPDIQAVEFPDDTLEADDPTVEMEEKWRLYHLKKDDVPLYEEEMNISVEVDIDDEHD